LRVAVKTYVTILAAAALGSFVFAPGAAAAELVRKLSGIQIRAKFTNMQVTDEVHFRDVYDRDGTLRSYADGKSKVGKWAVEKDELCVYFKEPDDGCYEVSLSGNRIEMKPAGLGLSIEGILQTPTDRN
jgi:hypothetical protein